MKRHHVVKLQKDLEALSTAGGIQMHQQEVINQAKEAVGAYLAGQKIEDEPKPAAEPVAKPWPAPPMSPVPPGAQSSKEKEKS